MAKQSGPGHTRGAGRGGTPALHSLASAPALASPGSGRHLGMNEWIGALSLSASQIKKIEYAFVSETAFLSKCGSSACSTEHPGLPRVSRPGVVAPVSAVPLKGLVCHTSLEKTAI